MTRDEILKQYGEPEPPFHARKDLVKLGMGSLRKIDQLHADGEGPPRVWIGGVRRTPDNWLKRWLLNNISI